MRPEDLALLRTPGVPTVSPDGRMAVVAVGRPDLAGDVDRSRLWAVPTDGSAPARPLTSGWCDTDPVFSPDGRWLAYRGAEPGGPPQLHLLPTAGGAPRQLPGHPLGAGRPVWSPDARRLAYTARVPEVDRSGADRAGQPPWLVTTLRWQADGVGVITDRHSHVFVLDLPPDTEDDGTPLPRPRQVTDGAADDTDVTWSPDGAELAFVSARHARADRDLVHDVYAVPAAGGTLRRVTDGRGDCSLPAYDPCGGWIWVTARLDLGPDGLDVAGRGATLCRVPVAGGASEPVLDPASTDRGDGTPATVLAGGAAHLGVHRRGAVELLRVPLDGGPPETLVDGPFTVHGLAAAGGVVVATVGHDRSAGELIAVTPGRRRLLTAFGRGLAGTGALRRSEERTATAPDGAEVHGRVTLPDGPGPHPVLLSLHDGPHRQDGWSLSVDTQTLVSAGYAVVRCDPRGAAGYGQAHARAVRGAGGTVDADDVLAFLDAVLADPALDPERVGVMGAGYGGWLATVLTGRTTLFAAAVVEGGPHRPRRARRLLGRRLVVRRPGPRRRSARPPCGRPHADARGARRGRPALPARAGAAALHRPQAARRPGGAAAVPGGGLGPGPQRPPPGTGRRGWSTCCAGGRAGCRSRRRRGRGRGHRTAAWRRRRRGAADRAGHPAGLSGARVAGDGARADDLRRGRRGDPCPRPGPRSRVGAAPPTGPARPGCRLRGAGAGCQGGPTRSERSQVVERRAPRWSELRELVRPAACRGRDRPPAGRRGHRGRPARDRPPAGAAGRLRLHRRRRRPSSACAGRGRRSSGRVPAQRAARRLRRRPVDDAARPPVGRCRWSFAPTGFTRLMHTEGEVAVGRCAERVGIPYAPVDHGHHSLEALATAAPSVRRWFQLYLWRDRGASAALVERAGAAGYEALVLTVDTPVAGPRLRDVRNGFTIPPALTARTVANAARHPRWWIDLLTTEPLEFASLRSWGGTVAELADRVFEPAATLDDVRALRETWAGALVVKGVQTAEDARAVVDAGADAVVVSNHGGRQLDRAPTPLEELPAVVRAVGDRAEVLLDGGITDGADVVAAVALGARGCLVGRAYLYGLMAGGERGVQRAADILAGEITRTLQLLGVASTAELTPDRVRLRA
jgi:isopentenyl diphosphate isomerase/L-lactate dehydrogenase-like FMN-dependent dehydrogenase/dipeptidyl aminopeptidase/acylaminoacyl peptidase